MASILLRPFKSVDLNNLRNWSKDIDAGRYMSRIFPKRFDGKNFENCDYFNWFVIVSDGTDVGCIWLEKENIDDTFIQLVIIIGNEEFFGKGIGRMAIEKVIRETDLVYHSQSIRLNARKSNIRAQACYNACGFKTISQGVKTNNQGDQIEFLTMEKTTPNPAMHMTDRAGRV